jgi:hypothetical protein
MLAPISNARRDGGSSFRKLKQYIVTENDLTTGREKFRGDYLLADNLLSLSTAHAEMKAVAAQNPRVKDPVYHFQISWQEGEQPTLEQWGEAVRRSVAALGVGEHQYIAAVHENTENFHVHVMVNRVHPERYTAHNPFWDMATLDKVMRELEHEQGWREVKGFFRWDKAKGMVVRNDAEEMARLRRERAERTIGTATKMEHYNDGESFQAYVRHEVAASLKKLLMQPMVTWSDVHRLLAAKGMAIEKGSKRGYIVRALDQEIRVKASDVFRSTFAGKSNRETLGEREGGRRG